MHQFVYTVGSIACVVGGLWLLNKAVEYVQEVGLRKAVLGLLALIAALAFTIGIVWFVVWMGGILNVVKVAIGFVILGVMLRGAWKALKS